MENTKKIRVCAGFVVSGVFLFFVFRKINLSETIAALRLANYREVFGASCAILLLGVLRALRWKYLTENYQLIPFRFFIKAFFVGFLANSVLPARMGEIVRAKSLGDQSKTVIKTGGTKSLASIFVEKVFDGLILLFFFIAITFIFPFPAWIKKAGLIFSLLFIGLFVLIVLILIYQQSIYKILKKVMFFFNEELSMKVLNVFNRFAEGLGVIKKHHNMIPFLFSSIIIWLLEGLIIFAFIRSLNIYTPVISGYLVMIMVGFGIAIPSAPGYIGVYQFMCIKALSIWGISESISLSFSLVMQAATFIPMNIIGLIFLFIKFPRMHEAAANIDLTESSGN